MDEFPMPGSNAAEFDMEEGLALALSYLEDPSQVSCPRCGPDKIEVVCYLDAHLMDEGVVFHVYPEGDYTVVLYCRGCNRAAALDLSCQEDPNSRDSE